MSVSSAVVSAGSVHGDNNFTVVRFSLSVEFVRIVVLTREACQTRSRFGWVRYLKLMNSNKNHRLEQFIGRDIIVPIAIASVVTASVRLVFPIHYISQ